ncbi:MAG TPA: universal stress protein [Opitutaceae bacterium]|nr:universal stress protein [Opitutaceae bacterium]
MKTILAPIDFSPVSKRILDEAVALVRAWQGRLVILHVVHPPIVTQSEFVTQKGAEFAALALDTAAEDLERLKAPLAESGVSVETVHILGFAGEAILQQAKAVKADYIVMGSHGHGAFYDLIIGSTTSRILKQAACPVLVVPPKKN